jgi:hypothetical protein
MKTLSVQGKNLISFRKKPLDSIPNLGMNGTPKKSPKDKKSIVSEPRFKIRNPSWRQRKKEHGWRKIFKLLEPSSTNNKSSWTMQGPNFINPKDNNPPKTFNS